MERRACLQTLAAAACSVAVPALRAQAAARPPAEALAELPGARLQGSGRLRYFGLHIYDARLWVGPDYPVTAPGREDYAAHRFALELEYARSLDGEKIAERSIDEMQRAGPLPDAQRQGWLAFMTTTFPNVEAGSRITGLHRPGEMARFYFNGQPAGELRDPTFAQRFFGIWLGPQTSQPALRRSLLGGSP
ncbi:hypothetical protein C1M51_10350 [Methylibium sp. Pch-M]|uniref:chalcone isomerase family protein n=1 Tax=Methylibium sp. Pch-M TaxID=2082386 RepID=UPI00101071F3|nr:chalcone isomerase family protein [Methylibium sp. Pch-M]QAZ39784.1 hypothetical protein C1M51_10350 [Methylibium sp. Pch-M]